MLTREMKAKLYKQRESPKKTANVMIREFAFDNGIGDSTLPTMN